MKREQKKLTPFEKKLQQQTYEESQRRARSVTVGTCFGGTIELSMRKQGGDSVFAILQPVEAIELIHQLAANVGCHIHIQPRQDFASWRNWKYSEQELLHYRGNQAFPGVGWAPHSNDMAPHNDVGQKLPPPEKQPGLPSANVKAGLPAPKKQPDLIARSESNEQTVATKKIVNKRASKRSTTTT